MNLLHDRGRQGKFVRHHFRHLVDESQQVRRKVGLAGPVLTADAATGRSLFGIVRRRRSLLLLVQFLQLLLDLVVHDAVKQHVGFGLLDFVFRHQRDATVVHLPPLVLGNVAHKGNVVARVRVFARVDNHGKEPAQHLAVGLLQFVRQVRANVDDRLKLDVAFNLGTAGFAAKGGGGRRTTVAAAAIRVVSHQLVDFVGAGGPARRRLVRGKDAISVAKALEVQRQNGRDAGQPALLGGAAKLAALFALVARIQIFRLDESLEGGLDRGETHGGRRRIAAGGTATRCLVVARRRYRHFQAHVFNGIQRRAGGLAVGADDVGFDGAAKELKGILLVRLLIHGILVVVVIFRTTTTRTAGALGIFLAVVVVAGGHARFLHGVNEQAQEFVRIFLHAELEPRCHVLDESVDKGGGCHGFVGITVVAVAVVGASSRRVFVGVVLVHLTNVAFHFAEGAELQLRLGRGITVGFGRQSSGVVIVVGGTLASSVPQ